MSSYLGRCWVQRWECSLSQGPARRMPSSAQNLGRSNIMYCTCYILYDSRMLSTFLMTSQCLWHLCDRYSIVHAQCQCIFLSQKNQKEQKNLTTLTNLKGKNFLNREMKKKYFVVGMETKILKKVAYCRLLCLPILRCTLFRILKQHMSRIFTMQLYCKLLMFRHVSRIFPDLRISRSFRIFLRLHRYKFPDLRCSGSFRIFRQIPQIFP
jgi:hypothetical protein